MFDVGFWELTLIALVVLVVVGPERLPAVARTAGVWVNKARRMMADVKSDINRELREHEMKDLQQMGEEIKQIKESIVEPVKDPDLAQAFQQSLSENVDLGEKNDDSCDKVTATPKKTKKKLAKPTNKSTNKKSK